MRRFLGGSALVGGGAVVLGLAGLRRHLVEGWSMAPTYAPGDRVLVSGVIGCGECAYCRRGEVIGCLNDATQVFGTGGDLQGGQAQAAAVPVADHAPGLMPFWRWQHHLAIDRIGGKVFDLPAVLDVLIEEHHRARIDVLYRVVDFLN